MNVSRPVSVICNLRRFWQQIHNFLLRSKVKIQVIYLDKYFISDKFDKVQKEQRIDISFSNHQSNKDKGNRSNLTKQFHKIMTEFLNTLSILGISVIFSLSETILVINKKNCSNSKTIRTERAKTNKLW